MHRRRQDRRTMPGLRNSSLNPSCLQVSHRNRILVIRLLLSAETYTLRRKILIPGSSLTKHRRPARYLRLTNLLQRLLCQHRSTAINSNNNSNLPQHMGGRISRPKCRRSRGGQVNLLLSKHQFSKLPSIKLLLKAIMLRNPPHQASHIMLGSNTGLSLVLDRRCQTSQERWEVPRRRCLLEPCHPVVECSHTVECRMRRDISSRIRGAMVNQPRSPVRSKALLHQLRIRNTSKRRNRNMDKHRNQLLKRTTGTKRHRSLGHLHDRRGLVTDTKHLNPSLSHTLLKAMVLLLPLSLRNTFNNNGERSRRQLTVSRRLNNSNGLKLRIRGDSLRRRISNRPLDMERRYSRIGVDSWIECFIFESSMENWSDRPSPIAESLVSLSPGMPPASLPALQAAIDALPLIDNHTHQIGVGYSHFGLRAAFTEAGGDAQNDVVHTLIWKRSLRELGKLLNVPATEDAIIARRAEMGEDAYTTLLLGRTNTAQLLVDDGLYGPMHDLSWHDQFTKTPTKRIVRLERLAEDLVMDLAREGVAEGGLDLLTAFEARLLRKLDPPQSDVVGFKSIAAYRTGLAIKTDALESDNRSKVAAALEGYLKDAKEQLATFTPSSNVEIPSPPFVPTGPRIRIGDKATVDYLVLQGALLAVKHNMPLQFHTGHGDADMMLINANPLHLQLLLQDPRFTELKVVLLHYSWPYTKEAGWLASSFKGVYADIGELQAFASRDALVSSLRDLMHLAPLNKILYSSDAHVWPETYYFGALYYRQSLAVALAKTVEDGDLTLEEAIEAAHMISYRNAINAYNLKDLP